MKTVGKDERYKREGLNSSVGCQAFRGAELKRDVHTPVQKGNRPTGENTLMGWEVSGCILEWRKKVAYGTI